MKKSILSFSFITVSVFSTPLLANDFQSGWRLGAGYADNQGSFGSTGDYADNDSYDSEGLESVIIEGGYEFNKIAGIKLSYAQGGVDTSSKVHGPDGSYVENGANHDIKTLSFSTDVGYTFQIAQFDIKPYAELGVFASNIESYGTSQNYNQDSEFLGEMQTFNELTLHRGAFAGIGVRTTWRNGVYLDINALTYDSGYTISSDEYFAGDFYDDKITYRATIGWKF